MTTPAPATRPIRDGLFRDAEGGRAACLLGSRCRETGALFWPAERMNPVTRRPGTLEPAEIGGDGRLVSWTVVGRGLPGFASPYALAAVALDAGPTLLAQLADWQGTALAIGQRLELVIGTVRTETDGTHTLGPMFRPARGAAA
jgi:uncharacterized OB-fold protein